MDQTVTIKVKLLIKDEPEFDDLTMRFMQACNYVSNWIFDHNFVLGQAQLNKALYYIIRDKFNLKAQLTQSVIRTVVARYRTVKTQLVKKTYHCYDQTNSQ